MDIARGKTSDQELLDEDFSVTAVLMLSSFHNTATCILFSVKRPLTRLFICFEPRRINVPDLIDSSSPLAGI
jgi:hypothetical protein